MRVYDRYLNLLTETDSFQSFQFTRNYHGIGGFELHINRYMQGAETLEKGNLVSLHEPHKVGIILTKETVLDEQGKATENIKLTGTTLCGLMNRRITVPPKHTSHDRKQGNAETVMKHYVNNHFLNPVDPKRKFPNLIIAPNQNRGTNIEWESRYKNVADELEKVSLLSGLGWEVTADFNNKRFIFDVIESKDLTQANTQGNSPVFFSPEFDNVKSMQFIDSDNDLRNIGYVGGQGEGVERKIIQLGDVSGWDRLETFVDARDIGDTDEETDEELTEEEIEQLLTKRGNEKMAEMQSLLSLEAEIITPIKRTVYEESHEGFNHPAQPTQSQARKVQFISTFQYEKDFNLGDKVDIINKSWGVKLSTPIIEITEIHEPSGFRLEAVFGQNRPTLITKLNRKFNDLTDVDKEENYYGYVDKGKKEAIEYVDIEINDVKGQIGNVEDMFPGTERLWQGARYPTASQVTTPSKKITECTKGWILQWKAYDPGSGAVNTHYQYTPIPKDHAIYESGRGIRIPLKRNIEDDIIKYVYIDETSIIGHEGNSNAPYNRMVLAGVFEW